MLPRDEFDRRVRRIGSLGTQRHAQLLYGLVRWLRPASCVEVGTFHGYTAAWIARALQENNATVERGAGSVEREDPNSDALRSTTATLHGHLLCIDDFSLQPEAFAQLWYNLGALDLGDVVALESGKSSEAEWPEQVDFAFIDGDHSYEGCAADMRRACAAGASCIALHDVADWWGPREYLEEWLADRSAAWSLSYVPFDGGLAVFFRNAWPLPPLKFTEADAPTGAAPLVFGRGA